MNALPTSPIQRACSQVGGIPRLAEILAVKPPTIYQWASGKRPIPAERCPEIERATHGVVRCEELRPDVDWAVLRDGARQAA
jgi:DNA-binding transcriptional regulator YdaS (Cro superfamily)